MVRNVQDVGENRLPFLCFQDEVEKFIQAFGDGICSRKNNTRRISFWLTCNEEVFKEHSSYVY